MPQHTNLVYTIAIMSKPYQISVRVPESVFLRLRGLATGEMRSLANYAALVLCNHAEEASGGQKLAITPEEEELDRLLAEQPIELEKPLISSAPVIAKQPLDPPPTSDRGGPPRTQPPPAVTAPVSPKPKPPAVTAPIVQNTAARKPPYQFPADMPEFTSRQEILDYAKAINLTGWQLGEFAGELRKAGKMIEG